MARTKTTARRKTKKEEAPAEQKEFKPTAKAEKPSTEKALKCPVKPCVKSAPPKKKE